MYIEQLHVTTDTTGQPLTDALESVRFNSELNPPDSIARLVKQSLRFVPQHTRRHGIKSQDIIESGVSDCYGYTLVTSEALQYSGIESYVAYANGHTFTIASTADAQYWLTDGLSPCLNSDIGPAIFQEDKKKIPDQLSRYERSVFRIDGEIYSEGVKLQDSYRELSDKNPWLSKRSGMTTPYIGYWETNTKRAKTLVVAIMKPEKGRHAITAMRNADFLAMSSRLDEAHSEIMSIHGYYPEMDGRNSLPLIRKLVAELALRGSLQQALEVSSAIGASHDRALSEDVKLHAWQGDALRNIGRIARKQSIIDDAIEQYRSNPNPNSALIQGKIAKALRIRAMIDER